MQGLNFKDFSTFREENRHIRNLQPSMDAKIVSQQTFESKF